MTSSGRPADIPDTMRACVLTKPGALEVQQRPVPIPRADEVLVRVASVGVCGSDLHYFRDGRIGDFVVRAPLVLGHEVSGRIVGLGAGVDPTRVGERVGIEPQRPCRTCSQCKAGRYNLCVNMQFFGTPPIDGAFREFVTIQADFAHRVPDGVSDDAAALLEPLSVGIWACRKSHIAPGSRVLIAGAGPIGVMAAQAARAFGAVEVVMSDPVPERRQLSLRFGASSAFDPAQGDVRSLGVDAFIDASGAASAVGSGIEALRGAGVAVLVGIGADEITVPVAAIRARELIVTGVFRYTDTWPLAAHLVASGQVNLDSLVTGRFPLEKTEQALNADGARGSFKSVVVPP